MKYYYTSSISQTLAKKMKATGMPIGKEGNNFLCPSYAEVFDWFMKFGWFVNIGREYDFANEQITENFEWAIERVGGFPTQPYTSGWSNTWRKAANEAIKKLMELIN